MWHLGKTHPWHRAHTCAGTFVAAGALCSPGGADAATDGATIDARTSRTVATASFLRILSSSRNGITFAPFTHRAVGLRVRIATVIVKKA